ncbi:MAG: 30S ribosomal protein S3 [Candidatus Omnitrophota bacterium]|jgi:small subunit ribosomal protein S3
MGQKVHPYILRIGFGKDWLSRWISLRRTEYAQFLEEDVHIREIIRRSYPMGSISTIVIERVSPTIIRIKIRTSRPGVIIGRRGQDIERVKAELGKLAKKEVVIDVEEVSEPALEAQLVAENIAFQMTKRVNHKRAMKKAISQAQGLGCEGVRIKCSGRLGGAEIARNEIIKYGKVPLQTFRADIDYGFGVARTTYGTNGVKVWIYKGEKRLGSYMIKDNSGQKEE